MHGERPSWLSPTIVSISCSATILCRRLYIPRLTDYEDVEIMIVARPLRGEEGMGAAGCTEDPRHPRARVDAESATVNVHSCFWHVNAREALRSARCIQSPHLHQALKNPKLGIQRV